MGNDEKRSDGGLSSSGIFWLVVLGAGVLLVKEIPWQGARPGGSEPKPYSYAAMQDIDARLWQDPIGAVARGREEARKRSEAAAGQGASVQQGNDHSPKGLADKIQKRRSTGRDVLVLGVMVDGGPYPELVEARRRFRYAVLAGLNETGFVPDNEDHLGYFELVDSDLSAGKYPAFIAYEWMDGNASPPPSARPIILKTNDIAAAPRQDVLVLWLDEDVFGRRSRRKIEYVANLLSATCEGSNEGQRPGDLRFAVLGPEYTSTLQDMIKDAELNKDKGRAAGMPVAYYAYGATADDQRLLTESGIQGYTDPDPVHAFFRDRQIALFRTVTTDGKLATALKDELSRRGVEPNKNLNDEGEKQRKLRNIGPVESLPDLACPDLLQAKWQHVVLIAEWDTSYGRSLPRIMAKEFAAKDRCLGIGKDDVPPWVHSYSYLRGLDGQLPGIQLGSDAGSSRRDDNESDAKSSGGDRSSDAKRIERPEGQGQYDYLRRLTDQLLVLDNDLRVQRRGSIRAIGVLSSDVYDKLVILQALRAQFPDAVIVTTDLDARMLHPQQLEWTHNAIIASSYGLQLGEHLQRDIPPFRDSYQTSLYLSTMIAINHARSLVAKNAIDCGTLTEATEKKCFGIAQADITAWLNKPRIFEIGRKSAFNFSENPMIALGAIKDAPPGNDGVKAETPPKAPAFDLHGSWHDTALTDIKPEAGGMSLCVPGQLETCSYVHPLPSRMYPDPATASIRVAFLLLVGGLLLLGLATGHLSQLGTWFIHGPLSGLSNRLSIGIVVLLLAIAAVFLWHITQVWHWTAEVLTQHGQGEPIALLQGVSIWPTELIRALGLGLSIWFIVRGWRALDRNLDEVATQLKWQVERDALIKKLEEKDKEWRWWIRFARMFSFRVEERSGGRVNPETGLLPSAELFWQKYIYQGRFWVRFWRILVVTLMYFLIGGFIIQVLGQPASPYRGSLAFWVDRLLVMVAVGTMLFLIFFVVDATVFGHQLVAALRRKLPPKPLADPAVATDVEAETRWPKPTLDYYAAALHVDRPYLDDWISMHFVARRTHVIARLVYYPFIVISLMVLSRSSVFDNWSMPTGLAAVITGSVLIIMGCAIALRSGAERLRSEAIWRLTNDKIPLTGRDDAGRNMASQIDVMIAQIRAFDEGAFAPYSQQPLVKALLLPLTSFGGSALVEYLSIANF